MHIYFTLERMLFHATPLLRGLLEYFDTWENFVCRNGIAMTVFGTVRPKLPLLLANAGV
jgi:hypothetical protein